LSAAGQVYTVSRVAFNVSYLLGNVVNGGFRSIPWVVSTLTLVYVACGVAGNVR
jgi:hypothetical protein